MAARDDAVEGIARPTASSINFPANWIGANLVTVPIGADGMISIHNFAGATDVIVDVLGWYALDDGFRASTGTQGQQFQLIYPQPQRVYDSREDPLGAFGDRDAIDLSLDFGADNPKVRAYMVNVTAVDATHPGYFNAWSGSGVEPTMSTVNYTPARAVPNMSVVPARLLDDGTMGFTVTGHTSGWTHLVVDVVGVFTEGDAQGLRFQKHVPKRVLDTRYPTPIGLAGGFGPGQQRSLDVEAVDPLLAGDDTWAMVTNLTVVTPSTGTYLTVWAGDTPRPTTSNLNLVAGEVRAAATVAPLRVGNFTDIHNFSGWTDVVMDVTGTFEMYPSVPAATARTQGSAVARPGDTVRDGGSGIGTVRTSRHG